MKIMFSAGEASGDLHGANLARSLRELDPQIELLVWAARKWQRPASTSSMTSRT